MGAMLPSKLLGLLVLALSRLCSALADGAPEPSPLTTCDVFHTTLGPDDRQKLRHLVQGLQAAESYLGLLRLGRQAPLSSVREPAPDEATLLGWKADNATSLHQLLESSGVVQQVGGSAEAAAALAASCLSSRLQPGSFVGRPVVSVLLNYFKRPHVVTQIAAQLRASCNSSSVPCELVVNVDNPHEAGSWAAEVAAGFVVPVFSANLHEARGYNRAARLARGRYLVIWQDDQVPPESGQWLVDMIKTFDAYPQLGILGMNTYRLCRHKERGNWAGPAPWRPDPRTGVSWTFVHFTDFAPMAVPASVFWELGGLEEGWSQRGECGITGDWELCARAWLSGWQVGYTFMAGRKDDTVAEGGTHTPVGGVSCWGRQGDVSRRTLDKRHIQPALAEQMCERAWLLNVMTFTLDDPMSCPYNRSAVPWGNCTAPAPERAAVLIEEMQLTGRV